MLDVPPIAAIPQISSPEWDSDPAQHDELDNDNEGQREASEDNMRSSTECVLTGSSTREMLEHLGPGKTSTALDCSFSGIYAAAESISAETGLPIGNLFCYWNNEFNKMAQEKPSQRNAGANDISAPERKENGYYSRRKDLTTQLRKRLEQKAGKSNLNLVNGSGLKWDTLPNLLAGQGLYIDNWPEETKFPGKYPGTTEKKQGLWSLTVHEMGVLMRALDDPFHPLEFKRKDITKLKRSREPVIVCAPPAADSMHERSRCLFLYGKVGYKGHLKCEEHLSCMANKATKRDARARLRTGSVKNSRAPEPESTASEAEEESMMGGKSRSKTIIITRSASGKSRIQKKKKLLISQKISRKASRSPVKRQMSTDIEDVEEERQANSRERKRYTFGSGTLSSAYSANAEKNKSAPQVKEGVDKRPEDTEEEERQANSRKRGRYTFGSGTSSSAYSANAEKNKSAPQVKEGIDKRPENTGEEEGQANSRKRKRYTFGSETSTTYSANAEKNKSAPQVKEGIDKRPEDTEEEERQANSRKRGRYTFGSGTSSSAYSANAEKNKSAPQVKEGIDKRPEDTEEEEEQASSRKRKRYTFGSETSTTYSANTEKNTSTPQVKEGTDVNPEMEGAVQSQSTPPTPQPPGPNQILPVPLFAASDPQIIPRLPPSTPVERTAYFDPAQFKQPQMMFGPSYAQPMTTSPLPYPPAVMYPQPMYREPFGVVCQALAMPGQTNYPLAPPLLPLPYSTQEMVLQIFQSGADPSAHWQYGGSR